MIADHHVAGRGRDLERDAHHEVHHRHLDDPAADAQERRDDAGDHATRPCRSGGARPVAGPGQSCGRGVRAPGLGRPRHAAGRHPPGRRGALTSRPATGAGACGRRTIDTATQVSSAANRPASTRSSSMNATSPPTSAPVAVNSSSTMPSRRLATWRWRYTPADALDVTITRHERDGDGLAQGAPEPERQQRHDEDAAPEPQERPEHAGGGAAGQQDEAGDHRATARGCGHGPRGSVAATRHRVRGGGAAARTGAAPRGALA